MHWCTCHGHSSHAAGLAGHAAIPDPKQGNRTVHLAAPQVPVGRPVFLLRLGQQRVRPGGAEADADEQRQVQQAPLQLEGKEDAGVQDIPAHSFETGFLWEMMPVEMFVQVVP